MSKKFRCTAPHVEEGWVNQGATPIKLLVLGLPSEAFYGVKKNVVRYVQTYILTFRHLFGYS